jgi:hypothetical protein
MSKRSKRVRQEDRKAQSELEGKEAELVGGARWERMGKKGTRTRRSQSCRSGRNRTCYDLSGTNTPSELYVFSYRIIILTV